VSDIRFIRSITLLLVVLQLQFSGTAVAQSTQAIIRYDTIHHPVAARGGMVVSQNAVASEVGRRILAAGGNAVDASVAVGFALAVTLPRAGNIGGSGFMLIHPAGGDSAATIALDFRSAAPATAREEDFQDADGDMIWADLTFGPRAAAVPGTVAGLEMAWREHGSLPWSELLAPAIELATQGIRVTDDLAFALSEALKNMRDYPSSLQVFAKADGSAYQPGELFRQPDLAWSLQQISDHGASAFYEGEIADRIASYMASVDGLISKDDLANYTVSQRKPISVSYRDHTVLSMPPSSVGGLALLQMLNVLDEKELASYPQGSADSLHLLAETMKRGNANRRQGSIGDTDFVDVPVDWYLSDELAREIAAEIDMATARPVGDIAPLAENPYPSRETTHYSIVDREGNAVSTTYTLGYSFGSALVVPDTGILLDNQMRNFSFRQPGHANSMEPGKKVVSTMTPTLVFDPDGELFLVTGTPGGSLIHNIILQIVVNTVDYGMNIAEATNAPRIYQAWRQPELGVERGLNPDTLNLLRARGHDIEVQQTMGSTQSIMLRDGVLYGAADPRRPGALVLGVN
jgi:gamma-glutamyltranspeptidase/glutathione hydrolase